MPGYDMRTTVRRWGNSLALRIPKALAEQAGIGPGGLVDLEVEGRVLSIRPVMPGSDLDGLLAGITDDNLHGEIDAGGPVGDEAW